MIGLLVMSIIVVLPMSILCPIAYNHNRQYDQRRKHHANARRRR
jgi:uncharacterized membrane protein YjgN (DUF898 family)